MTKFRNIHHVRSDIGDHTGLKTTTVDPSTRARASFARLTVAGTVVRSTEHGLVLGMSIQRANLVVAVSELTLLAVLAETGLVERTAQLGFVALRRRFTIALAGRRDHVRGQMLRVGANDRPAHGFRIDFRRRRRGERGEILERRTDACEPLVPTARTLTRDVSMSCR